MGRCSLHQPKDLSQWYMSKHPKQDTSKHPEVHEAHPPVWKRVSLTDFLYIMLFKTHPRGILSFQASLYSSGAKLEISVMMYPGEMELARAKRAHSTAKLLHR